MIYLVCEDSGSGYQFWTTALKEFTRRDIVEVSFDNCSICKDNSVIYAISNKGNKKLYRNIKKLSITSRDTLILTYDNILSNTELLQDIEDIRCLTKDVGCTFYNSDYFCFEAVLLSYTKILDRLNIQSKSKRVITMQNIITTWHCNIENSTDDIAFEFNKALSAYTEELNALHMILGNTAENYFASLLSQLTSLSKYHMRVNKSRLGDCWFKGCDDIYSFYICDSCMLHLKRPCSREKFLDFESNSLLRNKDKGIIDKSFLELERLLGA